MITHELTLKFLKFHIRDSYRWWFINQSTSGGGGGGGEEGVRMHFRRTK